MVFEVDVPATTANLSCGFDVLGMALDLHYRIRVEVGKKGFSIRHHGEGEGLIPLSEEHLLYQTIQKVWKKIDFTPVGLTVEAWNEIPIARGLGSSAACIVAGVVAANLIAGDRLSQDEMIQMAFEIEGHPDNVLPAFLGGFTIALSREGRVHYHRFPFFDHAEMVLCIPQYGLSTEAMRKILPESYSRHQVVSNLSHLAYLLGSLFANDFDGFLLALEDLIHEPYRGKAISGFFEVKEYVQKRGLGNAAISGSGPTVILFLRRSLREEEIRDIRGLLHVQGSTEAVIKKIQWVQQGMVVKKL